MFNLKVCEKLSLALGIFMLSFGLMFSSLSFATPFTINTGETTNISQVLDGVGEKGVVEEGGSLTTILRAVDGSADFITLENRGLITSSNGLATIVFDGAANSKIFNYGIVKNTGANNAIGIGLLDSPDSMVYNYGFVSTLGANSPGIHFVSSGNSTLRNFGTVSTTGDGSHGLSFFNASGVISNYGNVYTKGSTSHAILAGAVVGVNIVNNYGGLFATGPGSLAIEGAQNDTIVNLYPGSQIIGPINLFLEDVEDRVNIYSKGAGSSSTLTFEGAETVALHGNNMVNVGGLTGLFATVDPTGPSVNGAVLASTTDGIHDAITSHTIGGRPNAPQLASTDVGLGMVSSSKRSKFWASGIGMHRTRDADAQVMAYDHDFYGGALGYENSRGRSRIGFLAGYIYTDVATDLRSLKTNSDSYFAGAYGQERFDSFNVDFSVIGGYGDQNNERLVVDNLNGFETAEADFASYFISPSISLSSEYNASENFSIRSSATGTYSVAWLDSYNESGTTRSNLFIDDRFAHALVGRVKVTLAYLFNNGLETGFIMGGRYRYTINDDIDASLAGVNFSYAASGDDTYVEAIMGVSGRMKVLDSLNLIANAEYALSDGTETRFSGNVGLEFIF
ncbi:MAG: autotransporter domain-containing protein [Nitrospinales bacterium]